MWRIKIRYSLLVAHDSLRKKDFLATDYTDFTGKQGKKINHELTRMDTNF